MSDESSITACGEVTLSLGRWRLLTLEELDARRAAAGKLRGYRIEMKGLEIPRYVPLSEFVDWASNLYTHVPTEYLHTAEVDICGSEDGLEADISWRVPIK